MKEKAKIYRISNGWIVELPDRAIGTETRFIKDKKGVIKHLEENL